MALTRGSVSYNDYNGQTGSVSYTGVPVNGVIWGAQRAEFGALADATDVITDGLRVRLEFTDPSIEQAADAKSTANDSEVGNKWLVTYEDSTQFFDVANTIANQGFRKVFNVSIPTADFDLRNQNDDIVYTPTRSGVQQAFTDWVTAFETFQRSPYGGAVNVLEIRSQTV